MLWACENVPALKNKTNKKTDPYSGHLKFNSNYDPFHPWVSAPLIPWFHFTPICGSKIQLKFVKPLHFSGDSRCLKIDLRICQTGNSVGMGYWGKSFPLLSTIPRRFWDFQYPYLHSYINIYKYGVIEGFLHFIL